MLEKMDEFFARRVVGYDEHMLRDVEGCAAGYVKMAAELAQRMPACGRLLDLGCGTGLELDEIRKVLPGIAVTGVDMTEAMLDELRRKHGDWNLTLILGDYTTADFGGGYDAAVSFETLHHLTSDEKARLYRKIFDSLKPGGCYIECDYMCDTEEQEAYFLAELRRMKAEQGEGYYHYDTPLTVEHQLSILESAGFREVVCTFREGGTKMIVAGR